MIEKFVRSLKQKPTDSLFNPWYESDHAHDLTADAPLIRRKQLTAYLEERQKSAKYLFIAEALGYQGGHFTGIAMTSERILLGHQKENYGVEPEDVFRSIDPKRTSSPGVNKLGMTEPTATIMWGAVKDLKIDPYEVVLWNAVPWHPYKPEKGLLSNRTPLREEMDAGLVILKNFLKLFPNAEKIAVGRKCEESLELLGEPFSAVRHPANGGAPKFREQFKRLTGQPD